MPCRNGSCRNATILHSGQDHMQHPLNSSPGTLLSLLLQPLPLVTQFLWTNIFAKQSWQKLSRAASTLMYSANCLYFSMDGLSFVSCGLVLSPEQEGSSGKPAASKALQNWWMSSSRVCLFSSKTLEEQRRKLRSSNSSKRGQFEMHYMKTTGFQQCCYPAIILCQSVSMLGGGDVPFFLFIFPFVLASFYFSCFQMEATHMSE